MVDTMDRIVRSTGSAKAIQLFDEVKDAMYALSPESTLMLGFPDQHTSTYYGPGVSQDDIQLAQRFLESKHINAYNTRLFKDGSALVVRLASAVVSPVETYSFEGHSLRIEYGDHQEEMRQIADSLHQAIPYAANENQRKMLEQYVESFKSGSIDAHKESQRYVGR